MVERPEEDVPDVPLRDLESALQDGLDTVLELKAAPVQEAYDLVMAERTAGCPYEYVTQDGNYWFDSCSTESGASYDGYVFAQAAVGVPDPDTGLLIDLWSAFGGAVASDPDGNQLEISGSATDYHLYGVAEGVDLDVYFTNLSGTFRWDGPSSRGTWLAEGYDPNLTWQRTAYGGLGAAYLSGGFSGLDGWSIAFDENEVGHEALGYSCEREVSGTISLRSPDGAWFDIRFDGAPAETAVPAGSCDGCGVAFSGTTKLGDVCVSVEPLLAMAAQP